MQIPFFNFSFTICTRLQFFLFAISQYNILILNFWFQLSLIRFVDPSPSTVSQARDLVDANDRGRGDFPALVRSSREGRLNVACFDWLVSAVIVWLISKN